MIFTELLSYRHTALAHHSEINVGKMGVDDIHVGKIVSFEHRYSQLIGITVWGAAYEFAIGKQGQVSNRLSDVIPLFEDFLKHFSLFEELTFAIELKDDNIGKKVAELIFKYGIEKRCCITSFSLDHLKELISVT